MSDYLYDHARPTCLWCPDCGLVFNNELEIDGATGENGGHIGGLAGWEECNGEPVERLLLAADAGRVGFHHERSDPTDPVLWYVVPGPDHPGAQAVLVFDIPKRLIS